MLIDRRYGRNWFECLFVHIVTWISMPFVILGLILFSPIAIFWKEGKVDPRSANEINESLKNG